MQQKDQRRALEIVIEQSLADQLLRCQSSKDLTIDSIIYDTIFHEKKRLYSKGNSDKISKEKAFWKSQEELFYAKNVSKEDILKNIIARFAKEIIGSYNETTYKFIIGLVPFFLKFILSNEPFWKVFSKKGKTKVVDLVKIEGPTEKITRLSKQATLIVTPTHLSNFDSIVLGYATYSINIPPMVYGAGLNLFKNSLLSFLMRNLGAYKVDREKKNELYKSVLKNYAAVTIEFGYHNLFYPGGTRSRSGKIEENLKFGLLGSGLTSYIHSLKKEENKKIIVVPCTINYGLCLEAKELIKGHLQNEIGQNVILPKSTSFSLKNIFGFVTKLIGLNSKITVCFGEPLDLFGNELNENGESIDKNGKIIDTRKYLLVNDKVEESIQRDRTYTTILGKSILKSFYKNNIVMETQLVAFAFVKAAEEKYGLSALKLLPLEKIRCQKDTFLDTLDFLRTTVLEKNKMGLLKVDIAIETTSSEEILQSAIKQLSSYHGGHILQEQSNIIYSRDLVTLYYYNNRLTQYGLEKELKLWKTKA